MIELTRTTGQKLLFEGKHDQAVPAAMQSLRFAIDVYGLASIELVPSYLILGEASIGKYHPISMLDQVYIDMFDVFALCYVLLKIFVIRKNNV